MRLRTENKKEKNYKKMVVHRIKSNVSTLLNSQKELNSQAFRLIVVENANRANFFEDGYGYVHE